MRTSNVINFLFFCIVSRQIYDSVIWVDLYLLLHLSLHSVFVKYAAKKHILKGPLKSGNCCVLPFSGLINFNRRLTSTLHLSNNHVNDSNRSNRAHDMVNTREYFPLVILFPVRMMVSDFCSVPQSAPWLKGAPCTEKFLELIWQMADLSFYCQTQSLKPRDRSCKSSTSRDSLPQNNREEVPSLNTPAETCLQYLMYRKRAKYSAWSNNWILKYYSTECSTSKLVTYDP
jgi:hypothetical protein